MNKSILILSLLFVTFATSIYALDELTDTTNINYVSNGFLDNDDNKVAMLIPAILLVITIIMFAVDFGAVGVSASSICALLLLYFLGIVHFEIVSLTSLIIMIIIMIYKINRG